MGMTKEILVDGNGLVLVQEDELRIYRIKEENGTIDLRDMWAVKQRQKPTWKDTRIRIDRITGWMFKDDADEFGRELVLHAGNKIYVWRVLEAHQKPLRQMLEQIAGDRQMQSEKVQLNGAHYAVLSILVYGLLALVVALMLIGMAGEGSEVIRRTALVLTLIYPPYACVLYQLFPDEIADRNSVRSPVYRVNVSVPILISVFVQLILLEVFPQSGWGRYILCFGVLMLLSILWIVWVGKRDVKRATPAILAGVLMVYSFMTPFTVNWMFDAGDPVSVHGTIYSMYENEGGRRSRTSYYAVIDAGTEQMHREIPREIYDVAESGDEVVIDTYPGALGMSYSIVGLVADESAE